MYDVHLFVFDMITELFTCFTEMSEAVPPEAAVKSEDKREIEDEEREKMLNAENKRGSQDLAAASDEPPAPPSCPPPEEDPVPEQDKDKEGGTTSEEAAESTEKEGDKKEGKRRLVPSINIKMPAFLTRGKSRERAKVSLLILMQIYPFS